MVARLGALEQTIHERTAWVLESRVETKDLMDVAALGEGLLVELLQEGLRPDPFLLGLEEQTEHQKEFDEITLAGLESGRTIIGWDIHGGEGE